MAVQDKILLVENTPRIIEMLVEGFVRRFDANITCVPSAEDALDVAMVEPHSVVIADTQLPEMDAITMSRRLIELGGQPVILMGNSPSAAEVIEAMRCGVSDFFPKPFAVEALLDSVDEALKLHHRNCRLTRRQQRLRTLTRQVIRERRELNERIELVCKDLVGAHKRLVLRVLDNESTTHIQHS